MAIEHAPYNKEHFEEVCGYLDDGQELTLEMVGHVFGPDFYLIMLYTLMDAQEAARAIQLASARAQRAVMQEMLQEKAAQVKANPDAEPSKRSSLITKV